jgi:hypothetical protein
MSRYVSRPVLKPERTPLTLTQWPPPSKAHATPAVRVGLPLSPRTLTLPRSVFNIPPLNTGSQYSGPVVGGSTVCTCNTVTFSLVAACGACQGGSVAT